MKKIYSHTSPMALQMRPIFLREQFSQHGLRDRDDILEIISTKTSRAVCIILLRHVFGFIYDLQNERIEQLAGQLRANRMYQAIA